MTDIFISYSRTIEPRARQVADALRALGYNVWRDDELPAHRSYSEVTEERLRAAKAVLVIWSAEAVKSQWVRAEADIAREARTLVQLSLDGAVPPLPFNQIQCADMRGWTGEADASGWRKVLASVSELAGGGARSDAARAPAPAAKLSICVLPFVNMSDDPLQEYVSEGICEDIITDLSKVSALSIVARNTAFTFKGRNVKVTEVARELAVSHVLEGSVRKATAVDADHRPADRRRGRRPCIANQAERYDRDLTDIFALQDEISEAIVKALRLKLAPEEKKAIERRGTDSVEAYNICLMARQFAVVGNYGEARREESIIRLCGWATGRSTRVLLRRYWAVMAQAQGRWRTLFGGGDGGLAAAERALALNPDLAEAHAVKARLYSQDGRQHEADEELAVALRLDPESPEVNNTAGSMAFRERRLAEAARHWEKATALTRRTNCNSPAMLITCYTALGDIEAARRAARITLSRAEKAVGQDHSNPGRR